MQKTGLDTETVLFNSDSQDAGIQPPIAMIYTGGTIGMLQTDKGLAPAGNMALRLKNALSLQSKSIQSKSIQSKPGSLPNFDLISLEPLIDSSNAQPENWYQLAALLWQLRNQYQGFVLLHGTDTLAYTASALSFLTQGLGKPVIVTGSQYPLEYEHSDAPDNVASALHYACYKDIQETLIAFGGNLLRGNRSTKVSTYSPQGFDSPNLSPMGQWNDSSHSSPMGSLNRDKLLPALSCESNLYLTLSQAAKQPMAQVCIIKLYPGMQAEQLRPLLQAPTQAVVLETYGSGNAPDKNKALLSLLKQATDSGIIIVNRSQCPQGPVSVSYATGSALAECGVISAFDMTCEASFTKLHCLLQAGFSGDELKQAFSRNHCGEFSV